MEYQLKKHYLVIQWEVDQIYVGNIFEGVAKKNYTGSTIKIRGFANLYGSRAMEYDTNIEFEKITISSEIGVRFALE